MVFNIPMCFGIVSHDVGLWCSNFFSQLYNFIKEKTRKIPSERSPLSEQKQSWWFFNTIWGQIAASSAWAHHLLDCLRKRLVDTMEQNERLAWRKINGRDTHGRWLRKIDPNRMSCTKLALLFYKELDWWCRVVLRGRESRLHLSDLAEEETQCSFLFL